MRRKYLFFACVIFFACVYTYYFDINSYILISLAMVFASSLFVKKRFRLYLILSVLIFFLASIYTNFRGKSVFKKYLNEEKEYIVTVENVKHYDGYTSFTATVKNEHGNLFNEKLKAYYLGKDEVNNFDTIKVKARLEDIRINANPKLFNEKIYYLTKNIKYKIKFNNFEKVSSKLSLANILNISFRNKLDEFTKNTMTESNANFLKAIFLSNTNYLDEEELSTYRDIGLGHLLAVSGLHVSLISFAIIFILIFFGVSKKAANTICIAFLLVYGAVISYPVSFLRAMILFIALDISFVYEVNIERVEIISIALIITLLINPYYVFSVSLALSYGAAYAIELIFKRLMKLTDKKNKFNEVINFVIAINIVLAPIQLYYFHEFNFISLLTNLLLLPIYSAIITVSFVIILASLLISKISVLFFVVNYILNALYKTLLLLSKINIFKISIYNQDALILAYFIVIIGFYFINNFSYLKLRLIKFICITMLAVLIANTSIFLINYKHNDSINMISIGQEEAILLDINKKKILIDVAGDIKGTSFSYDRTLKEVLKNAQIDKLDLVIISHFDSDHAGNLTYLLDDFKVKNICFLRDIAPDDIKKKIIDLNINYIDPSKAKIIDLGKNNFIKLLKSNETLEGNSRSLVCELNANKIKILFTGDIEAESENYYLDQVTKLDILKVAHHGSKTSSRKEFLQKTMPKEAIISCGLNNSYGHPHKETLQNLKEINAKVYRTDIQGMISIILNDDSYEIKTFYKEYYNSLEKTKKYIFFMTLLTIIFSYIINIIIYEYKKYGETINEL